MFGLGMQELIIVGIVAVLLFGKRLPEVARSMGKSYNEFRKGLSDIQTSIDYNEPYHTPSTGSESNSGYDDFYDDDEPTAPKFEPPSSEPIAQNDSSATESKTVEGDT